MNKTSKGRPLYVILQVLIVIAMMATAYGTIDKTAEYYAAKWNFGRWSFVVFAVCCLLALQLQIVFHEGGHLVCGLICGYSFISFRVGSFILLKQRDKFVLKRYSLAGTGGQCLLSPPQNGAMPCKLYLYGGALGNLAAVLVFSLLVLVCTSGSFWWCLCVWQIVIGIYVAAQNALPFKTRYVVNDGYNIQNLNQNPELVPYFYTQLHISAALANGVRVRDMPAQWFELPPNPDWQNQMVCSVGCMVFSRCLDMHQFEQAANWAFFLLENADGLAGIQEQALKKEAYYLELIGPKRPWVLADIATPEFIKQMESTPKIPNNRRILYTQALWQGNLAKAEKQLQGFEKTLKKYPYEGDIQAERELVEVARQCLSMVGGAYPVQ